QIDHGLADILLELPVALAVVARLDLRERLARRYRHDLDQVRDTRFALAVVAHVAARVGDGRLELLADHVRLVEHPNDALRGDRRARRHLARPVLEVHHARADLRVLALRRFEGLAEARIEALGDVPSKLEMLTLVVADRHEIGLVEQDVARHQHGIREEPSRDELVAIALLLELRHPPELAIARHGRQQPGRLGVRGDVALDEDRRAFRVEPCRDQHRVEVERRAPQLVGVVLDRDRMQVDDAEERVAAFLCLGVLAEAAGVVADRLRSGGLDAAEDAHGRSPEMLSAFPASGGGLALSTLSAMAVTGSTWSPSSWRGLPAAQQPEWPSAERVEAVRAQLAAMPPLVFAGEARALRE